MSEKWDGVPEKWDEMSWTIKYMSWREVSRNRPRFEVRDGFYYSTSSVSRLLNFSDVVRKHWPKQSETSVFIQNFCNPRVQFMLNHEYIRCKSGFYPY